MSENSSPLVPYDVYETHAVHIGTNQKSSDMQRFIDTDRADGSGLHLIDIHQPDDRIRTVANFLSRYDIRFVFDLFIPLGGWADKHHALSHR